MDGFLYADNTNAMRYWDRSDVPFYWSLAETFPLCDRWFASAPAQTYPNRMYLQAATCQDLITTDVARTLAMPHPAGGTIWEKLDEFGIGWLDYAWDLPDIALFPALWHARRDRVRTFQQFLADCGAGTLPDVAIVSPGVTAYTEENPRDIQLGEAYSASVINAVLASPGRRPAFLDPPELAAPGLPATGSTCQPGTPPPPVAPAALAAPTAGAPPAIPGLGIMAGTEAHATLQARPLTESQDERLRHLDHLARV